MKKSLFFLILLGAITPNLSAMDVYFESDSSGDEQQEVVNNFNYGPRTNQSQFMGRRPQFMGRRQIRYERGQIIMLTNGSEVEFVSYDSPNLSVEQMNADNIVNSIEVGGWVKKREGKQFGSYSYLSNKKKVRVSKALKRKAIVLISGITKAILFSQKEKKDGMTELGGFLTRKCNNEIIKIIRELGPEFVEIIISGIYGDDDNIEVSKDKIKKKKTKWKKGAKLLLNFFFDEDDDKEDRILTVDSLIKTLGLDKKKRYFSKEEIHGI
jgi:hypothetical protein